MNSQHILILGNTLAVDGIALLLRSHAQLSVSGFACDVDQALVHLAQHSVDGIVVIETLDEMFVPVCSIIDRYPDLPIIRANISTNSIQLLTVQTIEATPDRLLAALGSLSERKGSGTQ